MKISVLSIIVLLGVSGTYAQTIEVQQLAKDLYSTNQFIQLIELVDSLEQESQINAELYKMHGLASFDLSRYNRALDDFLRVRELDSLNYGIIFSIGRTYERLGRVKDAIKSYEEFLRFDSTHIASKVQLGSLYRSMGNYTRALGHFKDLVGMDSLNYYYFKQAGRCYQLLDSIDIALEYYRRANELNPYDLLMATYMTNLYLNKKDLDSSLSIATSSLAIDSNYTELRKLRGYIHYLREDYPAGINDFLFINALDTSSSFVNKYLGLCYYKMKEYNNAMPFFYRARDLDSLDAETVYFLANTCRYNNREEEGLKLLEKTVYLMMPDSSDLRKVYIDLAELNNVLHNFEDAINYYQSAYSINSTDYLIFLFVAQIYDNGLKDVNNAISFYEYFLRNSRQSNQDKEEDQRIEAIYEYVEGRINRLKEQQFMNQ